MSQATFNQRALVLRRTKLGESDLILTMLSEEGALLAAVAKGARKPQSSFAARTEVFSLIDGLFVSGRSLLILKEARLVRANTYLRTSIEASIAAAPVAELLSRLAQTGLENPRLFLSTLRYLEVTVGADSAHSLALGAAQLLKILSFAGLRPSLQHCVQCGERVDVESVRQVAFSSCEGGVVCESCYRDVEVIRYDASILTWVRYFLQSTFDEIAKADVAVSVAFEVLQLIQALVIAHVGKPLKSLTFLFSSGLY